MFVPAVPLGGIPGWQVLQATEETQRAAFDQSPLIEREIAYFKENITGITTAEELVADRTLLKVALGAFGLDEELGKNAFVEQILADGSEDADALANQFVDTTYAEFAAAFGFGDLLGPRTADFGFAQDITDAYRERQFEIAVGNVDEDMRLALNFRREMAELEEVGYSEDTYWFRILGSEPLRAVVEGAFNLPSEFAGLDIDQQLVELKKRAVSLFGDSAPSAFAQGDAQEQVINRYLLTQQLANGPSAGTPGMAALSLLQSSGIGSGAIQNLILSSVR